LLAFIEPFFSNVKETGARLRGEIAQRLRLAAPATILRDHLPDLLEQLRRTFPQLRLTLRDANQAAAENLLRKQEVDLAITELEGRPSSGIRCCELLSLPLHLLVPQTHPVRSPAELWKRKEITDPLICMPAGEAITKLFRLGLRKLSINWPTTVEVSSLDLIPGYVRAGFGIAICPCTGRTVARENSANAADKFSPTGDRRFVAGKIAARSRSVSPTSQSARP
jgi:DNA-binding transcriptional LysR family regulator